MNVIMDQLLHDLLENDGWHMKVEMDRYRKVAGLARAAKVPHDEIERAIVDVHSSMLKLKHITSVTCNAIRSVDFDASIPNAGANSSSTSSTANASTPSPSPPPGISRSASECMSSPRASARCSSRPCDDDTSTTPSA